MNRQQKRAAARARQRTEEMLAQTWSVEAHSSQATLCAVLHPSRAGVDLDTAADLLAVGLSMVAVHGHQTGRLPLAPELLRSFPALPHADVRWSAREGLVWAETGPVLVGFGGDRRWWGHMGCLIAGRLALREVVPSKNTTDTYRVRLLDLGPAGVA